MSPKTFCSRQIVASTDRAFVTGKPSRFHHSNEARLILPINSTLSSTTAAIQLIIHIAMRYTKLTTRLRTVQPGLIDVLSTPALPKYACRCPLGRAIDHRRRIAVTTRCASSTSTQSLPRVAQPSLWHSVVPRFLRQSEPAAVSAAVSAKPLKSKEWNPATFYIVIFLLIGSQAIQIIALRNELTTYSRKADAKISLLKEVIERVQRGEAVDVQGLLGTGDKAKEKEWEDGK